MEVGLGVGEVVCVGGVVGVVVGGGGGWGWVGVGVGCWVVVGGGDGGWCWWLRWGWGLFGWEM